MQKLFGLLVIIGLVWFALSAYTGDGAGSVDLGSWLEPIGGAHEDGAYSIPDLSSDEDAPDDRRHHATNKPETIPHAMKRKVSEALQRSVDRVDP